MDTALAIVIIILILALLVFGVSQIGKSTGNSVSYQQPKQIGGGGCGFG